MTIAPSPFDDRLFGYRFGRVRIAQASELAALQDAVAAARFDCIYVHTEQLQLAPAIEQLAPRSQVLIDLRIDFAKPQVGSDAAPEAPCSWLTAPGAMLEIAERAFLGGRFAMDSRLMAKEGELYRRWCAVGCEPPRRLLGYRDADGAAGFLVGAPDGEPGEGGARCELIGVAESRRGQGIGGSLMRSWEASLPPGTTARVRARVANGSACRFYLSQGYVEASRDLVANVWCL